MPQMLRMPSKADLPDGTRRDFVAELFVHFKEAGRPTPARIAAKTSSMQDPLAVSRETIRRLLKGQTISTWERVDAVLRALCEIGGQDPDRRRWSESSDWNDDGDPTTCRERLRQLLNDDIDGVEPENTPAPVPPARSNSGWGAPRTQPMQDDPWATTPTPAPTTPAKGGYSDEPPF
ncbi:MULTISPECIES: hypothetical protein [unclassified Streptomyces]|uniref:hypothetical protein n=1 Tax=unclassified Streptomyces TaxID=2593676 RepID=UPI00136F66D7|nr:MULTISPECIES: hypothetical protein [unclassified Streptomyces]NEA02213.1 hypothetical protein [Streptomyces sp. SID10116]MYY80809.1 hypothetical protein [Streptomyces sp. SID335]MYZ13223.1 hypothetical protein [Streptomyces sp. SID337]NDZ88282.1 hypothetical protein [Streptomyces sp. SID10115]NEB49935.1 hypothetical protein [Streptomyces sp. SID339]